MNKLPIINFHLQSCGLSQKVELDLPILLPKLQEMLGFDLQPIVIPLLLRLVRSQIKNLEKTIESKKILNWLTEDDELELSKLKQDEANLQIFTN